MLGDISFKVNLPNLYNFVLECIELSLQVRFLRFHNTELNQLLAHLSYFVSNIANIP
jgi:hypothetical protein